MLEASLRYDRDEDVQARLSGTIVRYQGNPIFIDAVNVRNPLHVLAHDCITKVKFDIHSSDVELDISSPPLGYVNTEDNCTYLTRVPARRFKQGVDAGAVDYFWPMEALKAVTKGKENDDRDDEGIRLRLGGRRAGGGGWRVQEHHLAKTILNDYPIFDRDLEHYLKHKGTQARAISRKVALAYVNQKMCAIFHTNNHIGFWFYENHEAYLLPSFDTEYYRNVLVKNNLTS